MTQARSVILLLISLCIATEETYVGRVDMLDALVNGKFLCTERNGSKKKKEREKGQKKKKKKKMPESQGLPHNPPFAHLRCNSQNSKQKIYITLK